MPGVVPESSSRIFISYRREDSSGHVLALLPALRSHFGAERIFKDTDNIPPGADFLKFIKRELESCSVLLAIIGREWLTIQDSRLKTRRLDNPDDFLRVEVASALRNERIRVIPVLIERASMPAAQDLPPDLAEIAFRNAIELSDARWESDVRLLIEAIERAVADSAAKPEAPVRPGLMDLQKRRAREIASHLANGHEAFESGDFEGALWACDKALLLDPQLPEVLDLLDRARKALDEQKISGWLEDARTALAHGDIGKASDLIDQALAVDRDSPQALTMRGEMLELRRERERERERARTAQVATDRARASFDKGDFEAAVRYADDALAVASALVDAQEIKTKALTALDERRRERDLKRRAQQVVVEARAMFSAGQHRDALAMLRTFSPEHELVLAALRELQDEHTAIQQQIEAERARLEAEEQAQRVAAERARAEKAAREMKERRERERQEREARRLADEQRRRERREAQRLADEQQRLDEQRRNEEQDAQRLAAERERLKQEDEARRLAEQAALRQPAPERDRRADEQRHIEPVRPVPPPQAAAPEPAKHGIIDENVQFTVFRRSSVQPEHWYPLLAFAHLAERRPDAPANEPDPIEEVKAQARQLLGDDIGKFRAATEDSGYPVAREGELRFVPRMEGVTFNPPERRFLWTESVHREDFRMRADGSLDGRAARGALSVFYGSLLLAEVQLSIKVDRRAAQSQQEETHARPYRRIFASYSHRDTAIVEEFEAHAVATGDRYLRDVVTLRSGEVWDQRLLDIIKQADVFQLFWSWNALNSPLVREEWRQALALNRPHFVRPVYWEEPLPEQPGLPPAELRRLHFQRVYPRLSPAPPPSRAASSAAKPPPAVVRPPLSRLISYGSAAAVLVAAVGLYVNVRSGRPTSERSTPQVQTELPSTAGGSGNAAITPPPPAVDPNAGAKPAPAAANPPTTAKPTVPRVEAPATARGRSGASPSRQGANGAAITKPSAEVPAPSPSEANAPVTREPVAEPPPVVITKTPAETLPVVEDTRRPATDTLKPRAPDPREEERRVREILEQYEVAYDRLDAAAVRALYPLAPANLAATFAQYEFYRLELVVEGITLAPGLNAATAICRLSHFFQPRVGRSQQYVRTQEFAFEKRGSSWIIVRIQAR